MNPNIINWTFSYLTARTQVVVTERGISDKVISSIGSPQGCVISPILFSIYVDELQTNSPNILTLKYADDTILLENLSQSSPSLLQSELDHIADWCDANDLLINTTKTKEIIFSNLRDDPNPPILTTNDQKLEQVQQYKYLGTTITNKLSFSQNTTLMVEKARKRLYIMTKLAYLGDNESLRQTAYTAFIESVLTFHLSTIYKHLSASDLKILNSVTKSSSFLGRLDLRTLTDTYNNSFKKRVMTIYANPEPIIEFDRLPSGRFRTLKHRTNLRKKCFRSVAIDLLNKVFS